MSKPTILFVPGAWHKPEIYSATSDALKEVGYPTVLIPLPSAGASPPHHDFNGDVQGIRGELMKLVESGEQDVILVSHSYTGMPASQAPEGLGKKERTAQGKKGGVIRLVYIMAFAMPEGFQPTAGGAQLPEWMKVNLEGGITTVEPADAKSIFYNDIPDEEADKWASQLMHQSLGVYGSTQTYAAWRHIPSTYVIGTLDKTSFTPETVDFIISTAKQLEPTAFDVVERIDAGHCLMISRPGWLANRLKRAAGESV